MSFQRSKHQFTNGGEANVRALIKLGYEARCLPIEALDHDARYTVIGMADVLEHMPFRKLGLAAHRLLRPEGVLFLSMPNIDNMVWGRLHTNSVNPYRGEIEHTHNFSGKRLCALLDEHGFRPAKYHISERYRLCMEAIAVKQGMRGDAGRGRPACAGDECRIFACKMSTSRLKSSHEERYLAQEAV